MGVGDEEDPGATPPLDEAALDADPIRQFQTWLAEAGAAGLTLPESMTLATATPHGRPSARLVLLRGCDARGFAFFTNYDSRKARELDANPHAALVLHWPSLERQVRIEGRVERVSAEDSDAYWRGRPRGSQLSALVSPQSEILADREVLLELVRVAERRYAGQPVPRPANWGGYRVVPEVIEFWQGGLNRLHDRFRYRRRDGGGWQVERLAP
jgi:pyridoxamine 5'-phosphate oxidase